MITSANHLYPPNPKKEVAASLRPLKRIALSPPPPTRKKLAVTKTRDPAIKAL